MGLLGLAVVLGGGFLVADRLSQANAGISPTGSYTFETTVERLVTVRTHGRATVKRVPVVRRVFLRPQTAFETRFDTRVVTKPGSVRVVERRVLRYVPVVRKRVVTVGGKTRTVTTRRLVRTTRVQTVTTQQTQTLVDQNTTTVVSNHTETVVNNHTATVPVTVVQNNTETETVVHTVKSPSETVTETQTVTVPGVGVTVTVPAPPLPPPPPPP